MENSCFDDSSIHFEKYVYPDIIKPIISVAEKNIDEEFQRKTDFCRFLPEEIYQKRLASIYEEKRDWLKKAYFSNSVISTGRPLLDMHKIAAVICRSILKLKPFAFDLKKANEYNIEFNKNNDLDWLIKNYLVNYKVAVDVAMGITLYDIIHKLGDTVFIDEEKTTENTTSILQNLAKTGLEYYNSPLDYLIPSSHESFYRSLIINLMINDVNKRDFDYLGFATNCFQIQQYTVLKEYCDLKNK